jgi:UDP-N-acetylmuramate: L-alanyl-gamma-D-glutamyl-meso-diaminopimelate ligase
MHLHLIGVCGVAMATLAALLRQRGHDVTGSDQAFYPPMSDFLVREGIAIRDGYRAEHVTSDLDLVVVGNAISRGNAELEEVLDRKIRYASLPEVIRDEFLWGARSVVIAGTHGKTTTTALTAWLLTHGRLDPSALIGGIAANFGAGYRLGGGRDFVIEGDEYDSAFFDKTAKFLKYLPDIGVVNNVEFDHADIYSDLEAVMIAFRRFVILIPRRGLLLLGADNENARRLRELARSRVETFGLDEGHDWRATDLEVTKSGTAFLVWRNQAFFGRFEVPLLGAHNVRNALVAIAVGANLGLSGPTLADGLVQFQGVKRRLELRGAERGVRVYDDFAHHPTAIAETLTGLRVANPSSRIWAVFEPRSATSCLKVFEKDFVNAFRAADETIIAAVFRAAIPDERRLDPETLVRQLNVDGHHARHVPSVPDIVALVTREARPGDLVILMSNGGFDDIHEKLLRSLRIGTAATSAPS